MGVSTDPQTFNADLQGVGGAVQVVDQTAVPPLQHAHGGLEEIAHSNLKIATLFMHQSLVSFRNVIAEVLESFLARTQRTGDTPDDNAGARIHLHGHPAVGDGTTTGHAEGTPDEGVAGLNVHFTREERVVRQDDFARARLRGKMVQVKIKFPSQAVLPGRCSFRG